MFRRIIRSIRRLLRKDNPYERVSERLIDYTYSVSSTKFVISPNRGLLRSVDKRLGYRKEKSQAKNWKRRWKP